MPEAKTDVQGEVAERIRRERERLGLSQQELARRVGLSAAQTVSAIENGERAVKVVELVRLAAALHLGVNDLLVGVLERPYVLWRERPADDARRLEIESELLELCRNYSLAEEWVGAALPPSLPSAPVPPAPKDYDAVAGLAERTRNALDLGVRPAAVLATVLEETAGVKVFYQRDLPGAAACLRGPASAAIVVNAAEPAGRRHYSIAHELFHLITWDVLPPAALSQRLSLWQTTEQLANAFASALLLPSEDLLARVAARRQSGELQPGDWAELAREYEVSLDALVWRLVNLRLLTREQAKAILTDKPALRLDSLCLSPCPEPQLLPERFLRLLFLAHAKGKVSAARIAEMTKQSLVDVRHQLADFEDDGGELAQALPATA